MSNQSDVGMAAQSRGTLDAILNALDTGDYARAEKYFKNLVSMVRTYGYPVPFSPHYNSHNENSKDDTESKSDAVELNRDNRFSVWRNTETILFTTNDIGEAVDFLREQQKVAIFDERSGSWLKK